MSNLPVPVIEMFHAILFLIFVPCTKRQVNLAVYNVYGFYKMFCLLKVYYHENGSPSCCYCAFDSFSDLWHNGFHGLVHVPIEWLMELFLMRF